jgi:NAD(P)H dehydrogenase (quinone)
MNILIVHAHPEPASFNAALKNCAVETLSKMGHTVTVSDLYAMNFNPVASAKDFTKLSVPDYIKIQTEQVYAFQNDLFSEELKSEMKKFENADLVIFNFPLWWFSLPAILKGWVDRVFAMGFAYGAGKGVYENGFYKNKKAMLCFTTGGPEMAYGKNGKNGELETILYHIQHGMFYFTGMQVLDPFIAYSPVRISEEERKVIIENYKNRLQTIFAEKGKSWA